MFLRRDNECFRKALAELQDLNATVHKLCLMFTGQVNISALEVGPAAGKLCK